MLQSKDNLVAQHEMRDYFAKDSQRGAQLSATLTSFVSLGRVRRKRLMTG
jgi:hypothetical protein